MKANIITKNDSNYPEKLRQIGKDAPKEIHCIGTLPDKKRKSVAIVGARNCSDYGMDMARSIAKVLAQNNINIISGLAIGVDTSATFGAIEGEGKVYEVLGCGVDICYPTYNQNIYDKVIETGGGIISEYEDGTPPLPMNFPQRNRIIAALADVVIVVEAKEHSGSLLVADYALEYGKTIFAVPGRVGDSLAKGTNNLIKQGAYILTSVDDVLSYLGIVCDGELPKHKISADKLEYFEKLVYDAIGDDAIHINNIVEITKLPMDKTLTTLMALECYGLIETVNSSYYRRV